MDVLTLSGTIIPGAMGVVILYFPAVCAEAVLPARRATAKAQADAQMRVFRLFVFMGWFLLTDKNRAAPWKRPAGFTIDTRELFALRGRTNQARVARDAAACRRAPRTANPRAS